MDGDKMTQREKLLNDLFVAALNVGDARFELLVNGKQTLEGVEKVRDRMRKAFDELLKYNGSTEGETVGSIRQKM